MITAQRIPVLDIEQLLAQKWYAFERAVLVKHKRRMRGGEVRFYKDGYTDLRGRFDYASLNTNEIEQVEAFSLLVVSEANGAVVKKARPPQR